MINLAVLLVIVFVPYTEIKFFLNQDEYNDVIQLINDKQIQPGDTGFALLPKHYTHLSRCGGEVMIDQKDNVTRVLFFTYRSAWDDFRGYVYRSDDNLPQDNDFADRPNRLRSWKYCKIIFFCKN